MAIRIPWKPTDKQMEMLKALQSHTYVFGGGSRGGGKSHAGRLWVLLRALKYPGTQHLILRRKLNDLRSNHIDPLIKIIGPNRWQEQKKRFVLPSGSTIQLHYLRDKASMDAHQGQEYLSIFVDEATQIEEEYLRKLYATLRTTGKAQPKVFLTCNPGGVSHGYVKRIIEGRFEPNEDPDEYAFVKSTVYDNPHLDKGYIKKLEALPEPIRSAWLKGDWDSFDGSFFRLSPKSALQDLKLVPGERYTLYGGLDHGTAHATVFTLVLATKKKFILVGTYLATGMTAREHATEIKHYIAGLGPLFKDTPFPYKIFYDPSISVKQKLTVESVRSVLDEYLDVFRDTQVIFQAADNNRRRGAMIMRELFAEAKDTGYPSFYYYTRYAKQTMEYLHALIPDPNDPERYLKTDTDADDFSDSLRYVLVGTYADYSLERESLSPLVAHTGHSYDYPILHSLTHPEDSGSFGPDWYSI